MDQVPEKTKQRHRSAAEWLELVSAWKQSGQTAELWCREQGVGKESLRRSSRTGSPRFLSAYPSIGMNAGVTRVLRRQSKNARRKFPSPNCSTRSSSGRKGSTIGPTGTTMPSRRRAREMCQLFSRTRAIMMLPGRKAPCLAAGSSAHSIYQTRCSN